MSWYNSTIQLLYVNKSNINLTRIQKFLNPITNDKKNDMDIEMKGSNDYTSGTGEHILEFDISNHRNLITISFFVFFWYLFAILSVTTSKSILLNVHLPFSLCLCQFFLATIISRYILNLTNSYDKIKKDYNTLIYIISSQYTLGFIFTNISFSLVSVSFAETIKSGEPITSVIIGYLLLNEQNNTKTYISLLIICIGVGISCMNDYNFNIYGFIFALLSNICFSARAVYTKILYKQYSNCFTEINFFHHISKIGIYILLPLVIIFEYNTFITIIYSIKFITLIKIIFLIIMNGICFTAYNLLSYLVLKRVQFLITHAVLNVFRRVVIILFTAFYFKVPLTILNIFGKLIYILCIIIS
jgi:solute carrier family 35 protein E1